MAQVPLIIIINCACDDYLHRVLFSVPLGLTPFSLVPRFGASLAPVHACVVGRFEEGMYVALYAGSPKLLLVPLI